MITLTQIMHVTSGERTFVKDDDTFGIVKRTGLFGSTETSCVTVQLDDGSYKAYVGSNQVEQVVNTDTSKDGNGLDVELPIDVKEIGPELLTELGLDATNQAALFQKFMVLPKETRRQKMTDWSSSKDDPVASSIFLSEILGLLEDDTLFVQTEAQNIFKHLDSDLRGSMLTKLNSTTTADQRKDLIVKYTSVKTDKKKLEIFVQGLYELLIDSDTYITLQLTEYGKSSRFYSEGELDNKVVAFVSGATEEEKSSFISSWRSRRLYLSDRAPRIIRRLLLNY